MHLRPSRSKIRIFRRSVFLIWMPLHFYVISREKKFPIFGFKENRGKLFVRKYPILYWHDFLIEVDFSCMRYIAIGGGAATPFFRIAMHCIHGWWEYCHAWNAWHVIYHLVGRKNSTNECDLLGFGNMRFAHYQISCRIFLRLSLLSGRFIHRNSFKQVNFERPYYTSK